VAPESGLTHAHERCIAPRETFWGVEPRRCSASGIYRREPQPGRRAGRGCVWCTARRWDVPACSGGMEVERG